MASLLCAAALPAMPFTLHAQGARGTATTTARYFELRPIAQDTVSRDLVTELPDGRLLYDGIPVSCVEGIGCVFYRSLDVEHAVALTQDVGLTAWGIGVRGLSVTTLLRARADVGGALVWPRSDDAFDAILAYAELQRGPARARLGRQRNTAGLGFTGYDGASVLYEPLTWLDIEAYGGRSLARGLSEPRADALRGIEDFVLDRDAWIVGGAARVEPAAGTALALRYQRDIWAGRSGLVSERAAADLSISRFRPVILDASADYDFGFGRVGKAHLTARAPVGAGVMLEATARRYVPYFELWTIWGFFSPVAYHEAEARATWRASPVFTAWASGGWRRYDEANATVIFRPIEREGIRLGAGASWRAARDVAIDAAYRMDRGFGAFLSAVDASVTWLPHDRIGLSIDATAFQQIEQFRVGEGIVYGGGASGDYGVTDHMALSGGFSLYRQTFENRPGIADWNQLRGWAALRVNFGRDPGRRTAVRP